jgi:putative DNA primase/helicase
MDWRDVWPGWEAMPPADQAAADRYWQKRTRPDERAALMSDAGAWPDAVRSSFRKIGYTSTEADRRVLEIVEEGRPGPVLTRLADVRPESVEFLWQGRLALGKLNLVDGDPGLGKSTLLLDVGARVSTGRDMPDGSPGIGRAGVVIQSAEDGLADTIRPRLEAAGADLSRIVALEIGDEAGLRPAFIPDDLDHVEAAIRKTRARLWIVDPLMAYLGAEVNSYRDQDVRRALARITAIAERTGVCAVLIRHLTKAMGGSALYRGGGSIGIIGAARSGLLVARDPDDESGARRILAVTKSNLGPEAPSLSFTVESASIGDGISTSRIAWGETSAHTATGLLAPPVDDEQRSASDEAAALLRDLLASGPVPAKAVQAAVHDAGIAWRTVERVKVRLGIKSVRPGGFTGPWSWALPAYSAIESRTPPPSEDDGLGGVRPDMAEYTTATVACRSYRAHQLSHRQTATGWVCDACESEAA